MRGTILEHSAALSGRSVCRWPAVLPRVAHLFCIVISMGAFWLPNGPKKPSQAGGRGLTAAGARTVTQSPSVPKVHGRGSRRRTLAAVRGDRGPAVTFGPNPSTRRVSPGTEELRPSCPSAAAPPAPHPRVLRAERGREGHAQTGVGGTVGQEPTRW